MMFPLRDNVIDLAEPSSWSVCANNIHAQTRRTRDDYQLPAIKPRHSQETTHIHNDNPYCYACTRDGIAMANSDQLNCTREVKMSKTNRHKFRNSVYEEANHETRLSSSSSSSTVTIGKPIRWRKKEINSIMLASCVFCDVRIYENVSNETVASL